MAGPNPNFAAVWTQIGKAIKPFDQLYAWAGSASPNLLDMLDSLATDQDGVYTSRYEAVVSGLVRSNIASVLQPSNVQQAWIPGLLELADIIDSDATDPAGILADLRVYMTDNSQTINSLNVTHGSVSADSNSHGGSGNTGNAVINRLNVDENGDELMTATGIGGAGEVKYAQVTRDQNSGVREWDERLKFYGAPVRNFPLELSGSGTLAENARFLHCGGESTGRYLQNPSFDLGTSQTDNTALSATTDVTGWVVDTAANWKWQTAASRRGYPGAPSTQYGLECTASDTITQTLASTRPQVDYSAAPMYAEVNIMRKSSATGTVTLTVGSQSSNVALSGLTNDQWHTLRLEIGTKNWFNNWNTDGATVAIDVATLATGTVYIDDVQFAPFTQIGGTWYAPVGGDDNSLTPPEVLDRWTWTDSHADTGVLMFWLWWAFGEVLPHTTGGTETISDPS